MRPRLEVSVHLRSPNGAPEFQPFAFIYPYGRDFVIVRNLTNWEIRLLADWAGEQVVAGRVIPDYCRFAEDGWAVGMRQEAANAS